MYSNFEPIKTNPNKQELPIFRPLTVDIINNSFQVNSYINDFSVNDSNISEISQDISIKELSNTLYSKIQQNDENVNNNSFYESMISMIPSKSNSDIFDKKDQIIKEIANKIKKFYQQNNKLIEKGQNGYFIVNQSISNQSVHYPFYSLVSENNSIEFPLRNDFDISENVQIATNGIELFLLVDHFVFIFKLLIGTKLLVDSYKRVDLDPNIKDYNQIVCYGQDVIVTCSTRNFVIRRKINNEWEIQNEMIESFQNKLLCSDGVVFVVLDLENIKINKSIPFKVYSLNDGSFIFERSISYNNSVNRIPENLMNPKFILTNGTNLTIITFKDNDKNKWTYLNFSLINADLISIEEKNDGFNNFLCIHHDSINNARWVLLEKKINEITTVYSIGRSPSFAPYDPFVCNEMKSHIEKIKINYFGYYNYKFLSNRVLGQKEKKILYGLSLSNFKNNDRFMFMFIFSSLFFNPFISGMDQVVDPKKSLGMHQQMVMKFRIDDIIIEKDEEVDMDYINDIENFHVYTNEILKRFIECFFSDSFENCPVFALWILRQYQFSWYSKMHSQKMLQSYKSIFDIVYNQDIRISSLFLNILSINSISNAMVEIDDINQQEKESALFTYFLQLIGYSNKKSDNEIIKNFLNVVFDLIPLISYRKRMVVTYFSFLEKYGFSSLRSFFDYSLFVSMAISCLLVSKNDVRWSYCSETDAKKIQNESNINSNNTNQTQQICIDSDGKSNLSNNQSIDFSKTVTSTRIMKSYPNQSNDNSKTSFNLIDFQSQSINSIGTQNSVDNSNNTQNQSIYSNDMERSSINSSDIKCENLLLYMPVIYGNWKPLVNKNINEKVKLFDAKCLYVFYKLIKGETIDSILPNIKSFIKSDKDLLMSLDLMYSYRNKYRKSMQDKNEKWIEQTDILLRVMNKLKCNFGDNDKKSLINEFMQHDYHIAYNFLYDDKNKKKLIEKGMSQLVKMLNDITQNPHEIQYQDIVQTPYQLLAMLFDLLTRFSKFNSIEMIKNETKSFKAFQQVIKKIFEIDNSQCINKFSALYIIRSLESCDDVKLKKSILTNLLTVYDIKKGNYNIINQNSEIIFIYDILILWLIPLIDRNQLNFLNNNICEFKLFQWIILNRIIDSKILKETEPKDQIILNHLIESITNVDIFVQLGNNKTIALLILNKLNENHLYDFEIKKFLSYIFNRIGSEIESFSDLKDDSSVSSYFLNEIKKEDENFILKNHFFNLVNSSNEFTKEQILCCSLKVISSMEKLTTDSKFFKKMINYFSYAITHKQLSSGYLANEAVNNFLSNQTFCDEFIKEIDIDQIITNLKSNNDQLSIIQKIHKINLLKGQTVDPIFDVIMTSKGAYFISPIIKKLCIGSLILKKEKNTKIQVFICEDSRSSQLFNVVTHSDFSLFNCQTEINIVIDTIRKNINISTNNSVFVFNNTMNPVRLVIFSDKKETTKIKVENENIFDNKDFIDRQSYGTFNIPKKKSFVNKQKFDQKIQNSNFAEILQNGLNEKICVQFTYGKRKALFSINEIVSITSCLKDKIIQSYKKYLTETTLFITAVKMVSFHPEILNYNSDFMLKIFVLLILNYDSFSIDLFKKDEFPFKIDNIILNNDYTSNYHFEDLSRYTIQKVLQSILNVPSFHSIFYYHMKNLYREYHSHFPRKSKIIEPEKQYNRKGFIFIPQFCENNKMTVLLNNMTNPQKLPYFSKQENFSIQKSQTQYLFYSINPQKRNWIFNSPFEFLVLLKYFIFLSKTSKERELIKSCLFEAGFINSPILSKYSIEFLKYIFLQNPYDNDDMDDANLSYQKSLLFYQEKTQDCDTFFKLFQKIEIMSKSDKCASIFYQIFPEFSKNSREKDKGKLKFCIKDFSIYSRFGEDEENSLFNSYKLYNMIKFFKIKDKSQFPYLSFFKFWATAQQEQMEIMREDITKIDLKKLKQQFTSDMNDFILQWTDEYTKELLKNLNEIELNVPKIPFYIVSKTARRLTSLHPKFQMSLILTVVLILCEVNRVFTFCDFDSLSKLVPDFIDFLIPDGATQIIRSSIVVNENNQDVPRLLIDRKSVYLNQSGCNSIIEQFSNEIKKVDMHNLQCIKPPFRVTFRNEAAIDASGPMRELMTEVASSIFQKKTNLTIQTPSDLSLYIPFTTNFNKTKDIYYSIGVYIGIVIRTNTPQSIPFAPLVWNYLANETITEEDIVSVDRNLGQMFKNIRKSVEDKCEVHFPWKGTNWNSIEYTIKGKIGKYVNENEVEEFIQTVVNDRINAILNPLIQMRNGLANNLGFRPNLPFGKVFSKMAQSESTFTVEDLMAISRYSACTFESHFVSVFWQAVRRLTMDQLTLLLKFITTQTRIPRDSSSNFIINICAKEAYGNTKSDDMLLSASTCFNRLYLPSYSTPDIAYKKIIISIEYCQTMELS